MANTGSARRFSEADKAKALTVLASTGGNVKRAARESGVLPATIRRWRDQASRGKGPDQKLIVAAVQSFVDQAELVRNLALDQLESRLRAGEGNIRELGTVLGILDDKVTRAKGLPTHNVQTTSTLPDAGVLRELMAGFIEGSVRAAEAREAEIVEAEIVELPSGS